MKAHMSWIFQDTITNSLLKSFQVLMEESLILEEHAG